jgi:hypothetical protein
MDALIEKLSSGQIVAVISIISGAAVALAMIVAIAKYQFQALADDTALKRERQQAELALHEKMIGRDDAAGEPLAPLAGTPGQPNLDVQLAKRFGTLGLDQDEIERALGRALAADPQRKRMTLEVMDELTGYHASPEAVLAAIRPLCVPVRRDLAPASA